LEEALGGGLSEGRGSVGKIYHSDVSLGDYHLLNHDYSILNDFVLYVHVGVDRQHYSHYEICFCFDIWKF
jgi:hypothetical protein